MCRDCGRYFLGDATYHHSKKLREEALRLYANGMSMRAISRAFQVSALPYRSVPTRQVTSPTFAVAGLLGDTHHVSEVLDFKKSCLGSPSRASLFKI